MVSHQSSRVQRSYLLITLMSTLAASFIWGVNTLFLLDAGLSNTQAFTVNAFFTAGMVLFEVPTGVVADTWGRRGSYLLGTATLLASTLLYLLMWWIEGPFYGWALSSILIGLGFTFFSGATEAWLVDALEFTGFEGTLESVFAKSQIVSGIAMLTGSVAGGYIAQITNLGVPFILRCVMLAATFAVAYIYMHDLGFIKKETTSPVKEMKQIVGASVEHGWRNPPVKWLMLAAPFNMGVGIYAFYAMQPYLLELWGNSEAYAIAGLAAAIVAGAQIVGGLLVGYIPKLFKSRTSVLIFVTLTSVIVLALIGLTNNFWTAVGLLVVWALVFAAARPVRQAYINGVIPSQQRATVLSFDSLMSSGGGVITQPALGRVADQFSYSTSYVVCSAIQIVALPFIYLAKKTRAESDSNQPSKVSDTQT